MAILAPGDKILAAHRKLFENDAPRYFIGTVTEYESGVFKVVGNSFFHDAATGRVFKKDDTRTKICSVASGAMLIYLLPEDASLDQIEFRGHLGSLMLTDGLHFEMNLSEQFGDLSEAQRARSKVLLRTPR